MKHHLKHMAIGGGLILAVLLVLKVDLGTALTYALLLACPLGMVGMMFMMNRGQGHGHGTGGQEHGAGAHDHCGTDQKGAAQADGATEAEQSLSRENHERIV